MSTTPHTPPSHLAGLNRSEHVEAGLSAHLQGSSGAHTTSMSRMTPPDPRLGHLTGTTDKSSSTGMSTGNSAGDEHVQRPADVAAPSTGAPSHSEQKPLQSMSDMALQPPPPLSMRRPTAASFSSSSSVQSIPLGDCIGDGTNSHSSSSSHSISLTSSHYLFAIQRDLESIARLQQLQLQERRVSLPSEVSTTGSVSMMWRGSEKVVAAPSVTGAHSCVSASLDNADPAMRLQSIDHAKQAWFEEEAAAHAPPRQQQSQETVPLSYPPRWTVAPAGAHAAKVSDVAPQLWLGPWPPRVASGVSITAGAGVADMHQRQQPPPPPPSSSPIPASLVEYQQYLMQLEHQQRQHREVLRRHRKQRKEERMEAAQRGAAMITVPVSMTTPPRQRAGVCAVAEDRRGRSPPLAMMMQTMRQRRGNGRGIYSVDALHGDTSSSGSSATTPSVKRQRGRPAQKQRHPARSHTTAATAAAATAAQSRDCSGDRRANASRGRRRSAASAGPSGAGKAGTPAMPQRDPPARSRYRQSTPKPEQRRGAGALSNPTSSRSMYVNPQRLAAAVVEGQDGQHLLLRMAPLIMGALPSSCPLASGPTGAAPLQAYAETAMLSRPQSSSPVEAFADALLMEENGALGTAVDGGSAVRPLPAPPPPWMTTHPFAGTALRRETTPVTAVGGTATTPAPIVFAIAPSGAVVVPPGDVVGNHQSEAEMATAVKRKFQHHKSRERPQSMSGEHDLTTTSTTTPASSDESSSSRERGARAARAEGGAWVCVNGGAATPAARRSSAAIASVLQQPDTTAAAYPRCQRRSQSAEPILVQGNNGFSWRVARRCSRGAGATMTGAETHRNHPDAHRKYRHHVHNSHYHRSMEGISSTTPEHGTGTPRSSRYRYSSSSTTRQREQRWQLSKHSQHNASGADPRPGDDGVGMKHPVDAASHRSVSPGGGDKAHRRVMSRNANRNAANVTETPPHRFPAGTETVNRRAHSRPLPPSRRAAAIWQDVKLMWAPVPASPTPFAAVYRYHPHTHLPTSLHAQQQQSSAHRNISLSVFTGRTAESVRGHSASLASAAALREKDASRALTGAAGAAPSPPSAALPHATQPAASSGAPLVCMTDSLIGAALRDILPVCRTRQREVAREVERRRFQNLSAGIGGGAASATVL
ncbi:hypothetical protein, conserved [Leishmania tarentolae]|uniref:Uncharacterized protein n=1 Tax=Leishmania tarentolae TaxID=5689 RepID=A0A640KAF4_LEITA|nr:hypothetical protein, conserved [Leishmania tarentolae]